MTQLPPLFNGCALSGLRGLRPRAEEGKAGRSPAGLVLVKKIFRLTSTTPATIY